MEPAIGRSLKEGLRVASRSWAGMGFFAGLWMLIAVIAVGCLVATNPPLALFQHPSLDGVGGQPQPAPPAPSAPETTAPTMPADATSDSSTLFQQLATTPATQPATATPATAPPPALTQGSRGAPSPRAATDAAERTRQLDAWFSRAWPLLLVCLLLFVAANVWLNAGQIGYLAQRGGPAPPPGAGLAAFWTAGTQAFGALLAASLLMMLAVGLPFVAFIAVSVALPPGGRVMVLLLGIAALVGLVWLGVRFFFFAIAIVLDRQGAVAGFKTSFRLTRGRWWKVFGLALVLAFISYAVLLPFSLVEWVGTLTGGAAAVVFGLLGNLGTLLASLFMGFLSLAAFIQCYQDLKSSPPTTV